MAGGQDAGDALALLAAAFGPQAATEPSLFGRWLRAFDDGVSMQQVAEQIIAFYAPAAFATEDLIAHLHATIVGETATPEVIGYFAGLGLWRSELYVLAADSDQNWDNLAAVTLQGHAEYLAFEPVANA